MHYRERGRYIESNDHKASTFVDLEDEYRANPSRVWQMLLKTTPSGFTVDEGLSLDFLALDMDLTVVEPDWQNEIAPIDDYFADLNEALVESAEDDTSWVEEANQAAINDAALLALLAEESPSLEESDPVAEESELLEHDEAFEIDSYFAEPELSDIEHLELEVSLVEEESPAEAPAAETTEELVAMETYIPSWSSQYRANSWARFRW